MGFAGGPPSSLCSSPVRGESWRQSKPGARRRVPHGCVRKLNAGPPEGLQVAPLAALYTVKRTAFVAGSAVLLDDHGADRRLAAVAGDHHVAALARLLVLGEPLPLLLGQDRVELGPDPVVELAPGLAGVGGRA